MGYTLRQGLFFCVTSGRTIFLDIRNDRYFGLGRSADAAFQRLVAGETLDEESDALTPLIASGALLHDQSDAIPTACGRPEVSARDSILDSIEIRPDAHHVIGVLWSLMAAKASLRRHTLGEIIHRLERRKADALGRRSKASPNAVSKVAATFKWSGLVSTQHDQCLPRSFAMADYLMRIGAQADLVLGVKTRPFEAHCWVQHRGVLLNDGLDKVRIFTPILVI